MRVTYNFMTMKYLYGINSSLSSLVEANEKVYKGRTLLNPEDDPVNYLTAYNLQRTIDDATQFNRNANTAITWLSNEDTELQSASSLISKAKDELAVQGMNDSQNADSRKAIAGDVWSIYEEMIGIANANYLDRYIFGGYSTSDEPFTSGERTITSVMSNLDGGEAFTSRLYGDMPDLEEGAYSITATAINGVIYVSMTDDQSNTVLLDSNGSDETTENGNLTSDVLTTGFEPGQVISTGRGVGIKLPDDMVNGETLQLSFYYTPGDDVRYVGDDGEIQTKISSNSSVALNISGQDVFMETYRTVLGTMTNTINGLPVSETTYFSDMDGASISTSDSIEFTGTDHNGYRIGTARVTGPGNVKLDMTNATEEQRTITITYAGKQYDLTMDQDGYEDMDEVVFNINRMLENEGLGGEITAINDGDKLMFMTTRAGDGVKLQVTGSEYNTLGFQSTTLTEYGKDTVFELSYNNYAGPVETVHDNLAIAGSPGGTDHTYYVNGEAIDITVLDTDTMQDIEDKINDALVSEGMGFEVYASVTAGSSSDYKLTFTLTNQNYTKDTYLATRSDSGAADEYQYATAKGSDYPTADELRVSDMLDFIENLYNNAVDASIVDGKLQVQDLRSGESRLTFSANELNTGVGYPMLEPSVTMSGRYSGSGDDKWSVDVTVSANITLQVTDSKGNLIFDNSSTPISASAYNGEEIYLTQGVSITLGEITASTSFSMDMTAGANLSFGDLNVIEEGENVDIFGSLKNLYDALNLNIPDSGIGAPSAWDDTSLNSTAVPYFDGEFRGNYNDLLTFEVEYYDDSSEFYIQSEQYWASEEVRSYDDIDVDITLSLKSDQTTPAITLKNYTVAAGVYSGDPDALIANLVDQINADYDLQQLGVQAYNDDGKLRIDSGSGNTEINVTYNNVESSIMFGQVDQAADGKQLPSLDFTEDAVLEVYYSEGGAWDTSMALTIPAGSYTDTADLLTAINAELSANLPAALTTPANSLATNSIVAEMDTDGTIVFKNYGTVDDIVVSGDENGDLGFYQLVPENTVKSPNRPTLDVSEKDVESRTLSFSYNDGTDHTASITVDKENFQSLDDLIDNINEKLDEEGLTDIRCVQIGEDKMGFQYSGTVTSMHVSGDYEGTFGIEKGGDIAKMKVTGSNGDLISVYTLDTANEQYYVTDGIYHHYDAGYVYATDSYTVGVGSGIEYELPVLEQAESQIHNALTTVGNRQSKAESALSFNEALITMNEEMKAEYVGSDTLSMAKASTEFTTAQTVYQAALSSTAQILQISLLDYL